MKREHMLVMALLVGALSACHTTPHKAQPVMTQPLAPSEDMSPPASSNTDLPAPTTDVPKVEPTDLPTCACGDTAPKPPPKRKPRPVTPTPAPAPPVVASAPAPAAGEASVKTVEGTPASILGKKVRGQDGDDLGRVVDILADSQGRVRIAVIEFGGFLGVGNRRIAVDWSLLKFQPGDPDSPVILNASKRSLQGTPEYKGTERPLALMAPATPATPPTAPK